MRFLLSFSSSWEVAGCHIINNKNPETARQMRYLIFDFLSMRLPTVETRTHERLVAHRKSINSQVSFGVVPVSCKLAFVIKK
jgi:hypothetical protein